jgi:EAL domain-containing protein (putative c-di-GMP-specific phosphodiesterase class I)
MCDRAFMAIKTIKDSYDKKVAYYDDALRSNMLTEQEMSSELDFAMSDQQFMIYLQPQISASGEVHGAEALVRWKHPKKGMIMPGLFISAFEKNGLIAKLDRHVWEMACMKLREWKDHGRNDMYISVNISPKDIYFIDVYQTIVSLVEKYGIDKKNLKLEITETAVAKNPEEQLALIEKLRSYGFIVEMDDFGSGYSSLNMLKDIIVDILKIDMKFLGTTKEEQRSREILKKIVELSGALDMPVIVEGVETGEQVEFLKNIGCDMFQGYYFAKPMEVEQFEEKYM